MPDTRRRTGSRSAQWRPDSAARQPEVWAFHLPQAGLNARLLRQLSGYQRDALHGGADLPGHEFGIAIAELFGLAARAGRDLQNVLENLLALFLDGDAVQHVAA